MDIQRLKEFTVLASSATFREAAEKLGVSPALLSSRIAGLEKKLGVRLMERSSHRVELTAAGRRFLTDAKELDAEYRQILDGLNASERHSDLGIRIGMSGFAIPSKLGPYLDTVNLRYPDIRLEVLDDSAAGIAEGLANGIYDLFFTYAANDLQYPGVEKEFVYDARVQVLVPLSHPLANRSSIRPADVDGERFVLYPNTAESAMRECELSLLRRAGISFSVYEGDVCANAYFVMVPVGKGLALCPWTMRSMIPPNTAAISVSDDEFTISMYMFYRRDCANPYLKEFLDGFRRFSSQGVMP